MSDPDSCLFDFDEWAALAEADPAAFEAKRRQAIEDLIAQAPEHIRHRLRCIQWRIDRERERCRTPLAACLRLYSMMWDSVYGDGGLLWVLRQVAGSGQLPAANRKLARSAEILSFRRAHP
ncbi:MAG: DUF3135 domain-containing protein [Pseudomonadota bacterium]